MAIRITFSDGVDEPTLYLRKHSGFVMQIDGDNYHVFECTNYRIKGYRCDKNGRLVRPLSSAIFRWEQIGDIGFASPDDAPMYLRIPRSFLVAINGANFEIKEVTDRYIEGLPASDEGRPFKGAQRAWIEWASIKTLHIY